MREKFSQHFTAVELNERQRNLLKIARFFIVLSVLGIILRVLTDLNADTIVIQENYTLLIGMILSIMIELDIESFYIIIEDNAYAIVQDCLGWKSMYLLTSLYLATPNRYLANLKYLVTGLVIIQISNVIRVITTIILSEAGIITFDVIHSFLWQWGLSIIVFGLWYYWYTRILSE